MPTPGLQGDYRHSCIMCLKPSDTAIGFEGEAEWIIAGLSKLVGRDQAFWIADQYFQDQFGTDSGNAPAGRVLAQIRVCEPCLSTTVFKTVKPAVVMTGASCPCITQPD